ncbi:MAG: hypothetical protein V1871_07385 [Planctomycetota bacterium]
MKYFVIIIALLLIASTSVLGYFVMQQSKQITTINPQSSNDLTALKSQVAKLQTDLTELKNTIANQSLRIQTLKVEPSNSSENLPQARVELFNDPDFVKELQDRVEKLIKNAQRKQGMEIQKQVTEVVKGFNAMGQQMLDDFVTEFSKTTNLDAYQKQEFSKILSDRASKTMALLFMQFGPQRLPAEEFKSRQEVIRNESNEKVKQIFLPEQYEQYQKVESQFSDPMHGRFNMQQPQQQPPQQEQTPQTPK